MVLSGRSQFTPMSHRTKSWIKTMRVVQMGLRVVQIIAAIGLIATMAVANLIGWIMAIAVSVPHFSRGAHSYRRVAQSGHTWPFPFLKKKKKG